MTLTDFGDLAVLAPMSAAIGGWLLIVQARRVAFWWVVALGLCAGGTTLLKMVFYACPPVPELISPSGHTSMATLVYGAVVIVFSAEAARSSRFLVAAGGLLLILAVAVSRAILGFHSIPEVVLGSILGLIALAVFGRAYFHDKPGGRGLRGLMAVLATLMVLLHGQDLAAESLLRRMVSGMNLHSILCPARLSPAGG
jgi:membrane-associated phospholipid phosphatase